MTTPATRTPWAALAFVVALSFFAALSAQAQETLQTSLTPVSTTPKWSFGVLGGLTHTDFYGESVGLNEAGSDLTGGAFLTYRFHRIFAIQPELLYTRRSGEVDHSSVFPRARAAKYSLGFAEIPLRVKAYMPVPSGATLYLAAGPYAGVRLSQKATDYNRAIDAVDLDSELRQWDYGFTSGLGVEATGARGRGTLFLDARYNWGMANLFADDGRPDFRTRGLTLTVGFGL